jgi:hypothetical protein
MKIRRASWLLLCLAFIFIGCEGDEGPAGPAGPTGATGPEGPPGTANVIYSEWFSPATWVAGTTFGVAERAYTMTTSSLTADIISHGVVLVYMKFVGMAPAIYQLPVTIIPSAPGSTYCFMHRAEPGSVKAIYYLLSSPTTDPGVIASSNQVRYVLIPGGVLATSAERAGITSARLAGSLPSMPYAEVCRLFDIPE